MKKITLLLFLCCYSFKFSAQIKGIISDKNNKPIPFVSIYLDGTVTGTSSNNNGEYELSLSKTGKHTVVFQMLGFKTLRKEISINQFPYKLDVQLSEEQVTLDEAIVNSKDNPAIKVIRNAINSKDRNINKTAEYNANFYSRGLIKIKNAPKQILGQKIGDLGGGLDSTRSGIIYLSETVSKISYQKKPKNFKEHIIASKVSGQDNGISFNQAEEVNFNFYNNTINIVETDIVSPIANYAFSYYSYKLAGTFYTKNGILINKIKVTPKRKNDRVVEGFIYIIEDTWALYGTDITVTGEQVNSPMIKNLHFKQNYNYSKDNDAWVIISQTIDFKAGMLGINVNGRFSAAYSDYNFTPSFTKKSFGNEILSFEKNATKKDSAYWNTLRPIPLTKEEHKDYIVKDAIKLVRKSEKYLDSVDQTRNKLSWATPLVGYTYRNSYKKWNFNVDSPILNTNFNTVQGFNTSLNMSYFKRLNDKGKWYRINTDFNYGFSDKRLRPSARFTYKWNNINKPILRVSGGVTTNQFNNRNPIPKLFNSISSLFYERNYIKLYEKKFAKVSFDNDILNGVRLYSSLEFADRKPLTNTTDYSFINRENVEYSSNDPRNPLNTNPSFTPHHIWTATIGASISFGNKFLSYPDAKWNVRNKNYPSLFVGYKKTFGSGNSQLHSDLVFTRINQDIFLGNIGDFKYNIRSGIFLEKNNIPFMDYQHFNGNQTSVAPSNDYTNHFNLLGYYDLSTNDKFSEMHAEHNFKGFILNKIPLLNKLNFHLVAGAKGLFTGGTKPYSELSLGLDNIGWGKWRFLRVDYVRSNFNGSHKNGIVFGIKLLD